MTERPILFSAPMVRALLAGTKTQTRRVVKGAPEDWAPMQPQVFSPTVIDRRGDEQPGPDAFGAGNEGGDCWIRCPYGAPGDRLWVRETWAYHLHAQGSLADDDGPWVYAADGERARQYRLCQRWRPSIHMPRYVCRIRLEITGVRAERLQDISEADAIAEGIEPGAAEGYWRLYGREANGDMDRSQITSYRSLWESINGAGSWAANPWIWVVEFKRMSP